MQARAGSNPGGGAPTSAAGKIIKPRDVLLTFDGVPIANDGTVPFRTGERISFHYLVSEKYVGERATITYAQNGKTRVATLLAGALAAFTSAHDWSAAVCRGVFAARAARKAAVAEWVLDATAAAAPAPATPAR